MDRNAALATSCELMLDFAERTGLSASAATTSPTRYLWTDAFAVCTLLELARRTEDSRHELLARRLVDQVHHMLGRHRDDDPREGWLSGLAEAQGEQHPTAGGLRIGKPLPERKSGEPFDERLEWERDGQYFHYLTKWMHALDQVARAAGEARFNCWARELAEVAHARFVIAGPGGTKRMVWKMSIDLSTVQVPSMGHHDPLDGLITAQQLSASPGEPSLEAVVADYAGICAGRRWATDDALGLGGLLGDAARVAQLVAAGALGDTGLLEVLLDDARRGLSAFASQETLRHPAAYRLGFRELGLSLGLHAVETVRDALEAHGERFADASALRARLAALSPYVPLRATIESFWSEPANRRAESWLSHRDINDVMLAASLVPDGFLSLRRPASPGAAAEAASWA